MKGGGGGNEKKGSPKAEEREGTAPRRPRTPSPGHACLPACSHLRRETARGAPVARSGGGGGEKG